MLHHETDSPQRRSMEDHLIAYKRFISTTAVVLAAVISAGAVQAGTVPVQNAAFKLSVPEEYGAFAEQVQKAPSPEGEIETTNWVAKAQSNEAIVVTMSKMPGKILDPETLIESTRASLIKSLGATVENEEVREGDVPSVRLLFRSDAAFFRARFSVIEDRFYQLLYVGRSEEQRNAPAVGEMFESFEITPPPAPAVAAQNIQ